MFFPFSFWAGSIFDSVTENLEFTEPYVGFFDAVWAPVLDLEEFAEDYTAPTDWFSTGLWDGVTETLEFTEDYAGAW